MKDIELIEGEMICPICNGTGNDKENVFVCEKCDGSGKVDWVSNVIIQKKKERSSLDELNIRGIVTRLKSIADSIKYKPINKTTIYELNEMMNHSLSIAKSNKVIDDYQINELPSYPGEKNLSVSIKPNRSIEVVKIDFHIL